MPTWFLTAAAVVAVFAFVAALGMWITAELQHQRLLRQLDPRRRRGLD